MTTSINDKLEWFTIFRMDENDGWLYRELQEGRVRQGWGKAGCALLTSDGRRVEKTTFEEGYKAAYGKEPSPRRFAILNGMLYLKSGDVIVVPKMPAWNEFTIARVSEGYKFDSGSNLDDYRHIVHVDPKSVRTFNYRSDEDAYRISGLFSRANHRAAITFCYNPELVAAAIQLLERSSSLTSQSHEVFFHAAIDSAFKTAAKALRKEIKNWNGEQFEKGVRQAFEDQGYTIKNHRRFDGQGGDADILVSPPASPYGVFLPGEIAVQVKWKQDIDKQDTYAISQLMQWAESQGSNAVKCVISSASSFTEEAQMRAADEDVILIGGLQTICFLLGVTDKYRDDWDIVK